MNFHAFKLCVCIFYSRLILNLMMKNNKWMFILQNEILHILIMILVLENSTLNISILEVHRSCNGVGVSFSYFGFGSEIITEKHSQCGSVFQRNSSWFTVCLGDSSLFLNILPHNHGIGMQIILYTKPFCSESNGTIRL